MWCKKVIDITQQIALPQASPTRLFWAVVFQQKRLCCSTILWLTCAIGCGFDIFFFIEKGKGRLKKKNPVLFVCPQGIKCPDFLAPFIVAVLLSINTCISLPLIHLPDCCPENPGLQRYCYRLWSTLLSGPALWHGLCQGKDVSSSRGLRDFGSVMLGTPAFKSRLPWKLCLLSVLPPSTERPLKWLPEWQGLNGVRGWNLPLKIRVLLCTH